MVRIAARSRGARSLVGVLLVAVLVAALVVVNVTLTAERAESAKRRRPPIKVMAVVGDLVCDPTNPKYNGGKGEDGECKHLAVFRLINPRSRDRLFRPARLIVPGDTQYDRGEYRKYFAPGAYDDTFGKLRGITWPVPGNHEYKTAGASGYYDYFNGREKRFGLAGERGEGYYSRRQGCVLRDGRRVCTWRIVLLNTELRGDRWVAQLRWLDALMKSYREPCLLAVGHAGPFSTSDHFDGVSGTTGMSMVPLWDALYRGRNESLRPHRNADLFIAGHSHAYERFRPQNDAVEMVDVEGSSLDNPQAGLDTRAGVTHLVVGTGGESTDHDEFHPPIAPNEVFRDLRTYGLLRLQLGQQRDRSSWATRYYEIGSKPGSAPRDSASRDCN